MTLLIIEVRLSLGAVTR